LASKNLRKSQSEKFPIYKSEKENGGGGVLRLVNVFSPVSKFTVEMVQLTLSSGGSVAL